MSFTSWNVRSSSFHNGWQIFLSWILRNASTVRNITIGNITEKGFYLAVFWITLLGCAKQIQITIEDNKRKQSSFFYSQTRIFCLVVNLQWQCTHTFFFPSWILCFLTSEESSPLIMGIPLPETTQEKQNLKINLNSTYFTFLTFDIMLNISNL